jgi:hypothetical protein
MSTEVGKSHQSWCVQSGLPLPLGSVAMMPWPRLAGMWLTWLSSSRALRSQGRIASGSGIEADNQPTFDVGDPFARALRGGIWELLILDAIEAFEGDPKVKVCYLVRRFM